MFLCLYLRECDVGLNTSACRSGCSGNRFVECLLIEVFDFFIGALFMSLLLMDSGMFFRVAGAWVVGFSCVGIVFPTLDV